MTPHQAPAAPHLNVLSFHVVLDEIDPEDGGGAEAQLRPLVDGRDLLDGARLIKGCDPDDLLGRRALDLLPLAGCRAAAIGVCTRGELGCGSFHVLVSRHGGVVAWTPTPAGQTTTEVYRFDLVAYLDALETARGLRPREGRGRRTAREVRRQLGEDDPDRPTQPLLLGATQVDWVGAWPWTSDVVTAGLTAPDGKAEVLDFSPLPDEDDDRFSERIVQALLQLTWPTG